MLLGLSTGTLLLVVAVVLGGGLVMGVAGFGYAVVSTATLAALLGPRRAVVLMIVPLLAANVSLLTELDRESFVSCARRFWPFVAAAAVGTTAGMALLGRVPTGTLTLWLGVFVLGYVVLSQDAVVVPGVGALADGCFRDTLAAKVGVGLASGAVFGLTNVGVQVVAYLDRFDLDRDTFVGVLALVLVGVSALRVGLAFWFGLYGAGDLLALSVVAAVPGLVGVAAGKRVRGRLSARRQGLLVYGLLVVVGTRLFLSGLGVV